MGVKFPSGLICSFVWFGCLPLSNAVKYLWTQLEFLYFILIKFINTYFPVFDTVILNLTVLSRGQRNAVCNQFSKASFYFAFLCFNLRIHTNLFIFLVPKPAVLCHDQWSDWSAVPQFHWVVKHMKTNYLTKKSGKQFKRIKCFQSTRRWKNKEKLSTGSLFRTSSVADPVSFN